MLCHVSRAKQAEGNVVHQARCQSLQALPHHRRICRQHRLRPPSRIAVETIAGPIPARLFRDRRALSVPGLCLAGLSDHEAELHEFWLGPRERCCRRCDPAFAEAVLPQPQLVHTGCVSGAQRRRGAPARTRAGRRLPELSSRHPRTASGRPGRRAQRSVGEQPLPTHEGIHTWGRAPVSLSSMAIWRSS
jgi:hypothetical protein